ncbi:MAG TPA: LacI family DNA-binding transcriptional regulator [Ktedonobacteraceae bacterium]|jgi:LacI family transcriptional regulator|nr:LacI family DNA-binding transcriptional regulator [Ktedonobacteraceae bacterium]
MKKLTILDIARLAGVSKSTVSRVLNQQARVDPETRQRVLRVIEEHNFAPSLNAKGLKGQSQLIGMLVPALTWSLVVEIIQGIAQVVENSAYETILYNFSIFKDFGSVVDRVVESKLTAGLLAMLHKQSPAHLIELHQQGVPVVLVNTIGLRTDLPLVVADNYGGAYQAVHYLISLGHRRIGYINGPNEFPYSHDRYHGYCDALKDAGLSPDPILLQQGQCEITSGRRCAEALLSLNEPPTAIFSANDDMAYGVLDVAKMRGLRIPDDLSIVGFDDIAPSASTHPALTTIHQPFREMGQCAVELLLSLLDPQYTFSEEWKKFAINYQPASSTSVGKKGGTLMQIQLPTTLVVRESCGVAPLVSQSPTVL